MEANTLSLVVIRSSDIEASLSFYQALGVVFIEEQHGAGPVHYSCDFGGVVLELYPNKPGAPSEPNVDTTMLGFKVASLEDTLVSLGTLGIEPKHPPKDSEWGRWVNVMDPGGRPVQITQIPA